MAGQIVVTSSSSFEKDVLKSDIPVFVDFWAAWCGPCLMVAPIVEQLSEEFKGKIKFVKLNVDENPEVAAEYGIMSIPTLMLFKNGEVADMMIGAMPKAYFEQHIRKVLG